MTELEQTVPEPEEQYSKTGLVVFGILQIILGVFCLLAVAGMTVAQFVPPPNPDSAAANMGMQAVLPGLLLYAGAGVWIVWMGIGSIKARRWARDLTVMVSWVWLLSGIGSLFAMIYFLPDMIGKMAGSEEVTPRMASIATNMMIGFSIVVMIIIPAVLLLYYSTKHVKQTVMHLDPVDRWTGRAPLPVMVLAVFCLWGVFSIINLGTIGWIMPFFGTVIKGASGASLAILSGLLTLFAVWKLYKLEAIGWRIVMALYIFWAVSMLVTVSNVGLAEYFAMIDMPGMPPEQTAMVNETVSSHELEFTVQFTVIFAVFLGFLIYTKRFFTTSD